MKFSRRYRWFGRPQNLDEAIDKARKMGIFELTITPYGCSGAPTKNGMAYSAHLIIGSSDKRFRYDHFIGATNGVNPFLPYGIIRQMQKHEILSLRENILEEIQEIADRLRRGCFSTTVFPDVIVEIAMLHRSRFYRIVGSSLYDIDLEPIPKPSVI